MIAWKSKANINNPKWKYHPSYDTDVRRTIRRVQREMAKLLLERKKK